MQVSSLSDVGGSRTNMRQQHSTRPLLLKLGRWSLPVFRRTQNNEVTTLGYDESYLRAAREAGASSYACGDWRCEHVHMMAGQSSALILVALVVAEQK